MSCTCIKDIEAKIVSSQLFKDLTIKSAKFDKVLIFGKNETVFRPVIEVELECEGRKRPVKKAITYGFCPFCGNEFDKIPESPFDEKEEAQS